MQVYDPYQFLDELVELLRERGLDPQPDDHGRALGSAGALLRSLGITPAIDAVEAYRQTLDRGSWSDADDRRAARQPPPLL
jgi:hypothetical protein